MPVDEVEEAFFPGGFSAVVRFVIEILWELVCFYVGFPIVKLSILGKYPEEKPTVSQVIITATVGFLVLLFWTMWFTGFWR